LLRCGRASVSFGGVVRSTGGVGIATGVDDPGGAVGVAGGAAGVDVAGGGIQGGVGFDGLADIGPIARLRDLPHAGRQYRGHKGNGCHDNNDQQQLTHIRNLPLSGRSAAHFCSQNG
jgi:hypothetical protein